MFAPLQAVLLQVFRRMPRRGRLAIVHALAPSFSVGAMCFVERDDGALLLVRHSYRQRWGVPGGLLNRGEEADDAARREAMEEVGLDVELVGEPSVVVDPDARRVDVIFRARPAPGSDLEAVAPRSPEITEVQWFPTDRLPELQAETSGALIVLGRREGQREASAKRRR